MSVPPPRTGEVGRFGEDVAKGLLKHRGYDRVIAIQNPSGHGIDLIGIKTVPGREGLIAYFEIKTTTSQRSSRLSDAQRNIEEFVRTRLERLVGAANVDRATKRDARVLLKEIEKKRPIGGAIVDITGVGSVKTMTIRIRRWLKLTPRRRPRRVPVGLRG